MNRRIVVLGTDTGVGKTLITGTLAGLLRASGIDCGVAKPVQSGTASLTAADSDALLLQQLSGSPDDLRLITPWSFTAPIAPPAAAAREGVELRLSQLIAAAATVSERHPLTLVETAGGAMSPIAADGLSIDLAAAMDCPVLIVARAGLGTINHCLLTLAALRQRRLTVIGIVLNGATGHLAEAGAPALIRQYAPDTPVFGPIPLCSPADSATLAAAFQQTAPGLLNACLTSVPLDPILPRPPYGGRPARLFSPRTGGQDAHPTTKLPHPP